jgi:hypothetical protein
MRGGRVLLVVGCVVLAGCSSTTTSPPAHRPTNAPAADVKPFDLSRLSEFNRALPPDFVTDPAQVTKTKPEFVDSVGELVTFSGPVTVDPPQCRSMLKPVAGQADASSIGIRGDGLGNQAIAVNADDPVVASEFPVSGCDRVTFKVDNHSVPTQGTFERIEAPAIDGATVIALKVTYEPTQNVDYAYAAIVDGHAFVLVQGRLGPDYPAQTLLSDLLVKAVATLRGQVQPPSSPSYAPAPGDVDIRRLAGLSSAFPTDFPVEGTPMPDKVKARFAYLVGTTIGYGRPVSVDPSQCRDLFAPVTAKASADEMGVGAEGPSKQVINISVYTPVSVRAVLPSTGCERMTYRVEDDAMRTQGTADRLPAPRIDGAFTTAMRINVDDWEFVEYYFVAILDDRVFVQVVARVHPDFPAQPMLSDMLVKSVAAIRAT